MSRTATPRSPEKKRRIRHRVAAPYVMVRAKEAAEKRAWDAAAKSAGYKSTATWFRSLVGAALAAMSKR
jgi:hypothetical protein